MATSPSTARGESKVAWKVWLGWAVSESIVSTSRTARAVPDGIVTFCGAGGVEGTAMGAGAGVTAATGAALSVDDVGRVRVRGALGRGLAARIGLGLSCSNGCAWAVGSGGGATCRLF